MRARSVVIAFVPVSLALLAACIDTTPIEPAGGPLLAVRTPGEPMETGGMEGTDNNAGLYSGSHWRPENWFNARQLNCFAPGDCTTSPFLASGLAEREQWGGPGAQGYGVPPVQDVVDTRRFIALMTQDLWFDRSPRDGTADYAHVLATSLRSQTIQIPATGRYFLTFWYAFATGELNSGPSFDDRAHATVSFGGVSRTIFDISRDDLQPNGSGPVSPLARRNPDGSPHHCGSMTVVKSAIDLGTLGDPVTAAYPLCTPWRYFEMELTSFAGQTGDVTFHIDEVPEAALLTTEPSPRPSALLLANLYVRPLAAVSAFEGETTPVSVTYPPDFTPASYDWNGGACAVGGPQTTSATITCPDDGTFEFSTSASPCASDPCATQPMFRFRILKVQNLPPNGTFVSPTSVVEGSPFTLSIADPSDAPADLAAGFQYRFGCGDGPLGPPSSASERTCSAADDGTRSVLAVLQDKDDGARTFSRGLTVTNARPTITRLKLDAAVLNTPRTGQTFPISWVFTDPGVEDAPWSWSINWGDGVTQTGKTDTRGQIDLDHVYATPGMRMVTFTVTDKDGASHARAIPVFVQ